MRMCEANSNAVLGEVAAMLKEILECPHSIDDATIPKGGIDIAPEQVVMQYSIGYARYKKAWEILKRGNFA